MTSTSSNPSIQADLLNWAHGIYPTEAATILLIHAFDGRFARPGWPWIAQGSSGHFFVDVSRLGDDQIGALSGGERRVLAVARSLFGEQPVDLSDAITGLDRQHASLVIEVLAHAAGARPLRPESSHTARREDRALGRSGSHRPSTLEPTGIAR